MLFHTKSIFIYCQYLFIIEIKQIQSTGNSVFNVEEFVCLFIFCCLRLQILFAVQKKNAAFVCYSEALKKTMKKNGK